MSITPPKQITVTGPVNHPHWYNIFAAIFAGWQAAEPFVLSVVTDPNANAAIQISTQLAPVVAGTVVAAQTAN